MKYQVESVNGVNRHIIVLNRKETNFVTPKNIFNPVVRNWLTENVGPISESWLWRRETPFFSSLVFNNESDATSFSNVLEDLIENNIEVEA